MHVMYIYDIISYNITAYLLLLILSVSISYSICLYAFVICLLPRVICPYFPTVHIRQSIILW